MIVVPALHPCHEVIVRVGELIAGRVARSDMTLTTVGGKGINVARGAAACGADVRLVVLADERLGELLERDPAVRGIDLSIVPSPVPSRTDVALVEAHGTLTVLNSRAADPGREAIDAVLEMALRSLTSDDIVVLAGSLPDGAAGTIDRTIERARQAGARTALDASGAALVEGLAARPTIVKVAADELAAAAGEPGLASEMELLVVTDGPRPIRAWAGETRMEVRPPAVRAVNPLGAGDAFLAGLVVELVAGGAVPEALLAATALAASTVERFDTGVDRERANELRELVTVDVLAGR